MADVIFLEAWYAALRSPAGCRFRTNNRPLAIQKLYAARRESMDPTLATLSITQSPTDESHIWIVHREAPADAPEEDINRNEEGDDEPIRVELQPDG